MPSLPAIGLASAILQSTDFAVKLLQKDQAIHESPDGGPENHVVLQDIANNLHRLTAKLDANDLRRGVEAKKDAKLNGAAQQLSKLGDETRELTKALIDAVVDAQAKDIPTDPKWGSTRDALLIVWKKTEATSAKRRFKAVRKQVDAALLTTLRQHIDQSTEKGMLELTLEGSRTQPWEQWQNEAIDAVNQNEWKPKNKAHVEQFTKMTDALLSAENAAHFCDGIFAQLHFSELDDRLHSICAPHEESFEWIFQPRRRGDGGFLEWLADTGGQNLFWMTGKPGAGKSVLMRYLLRNERLFPSLEEWSGHTPGILTGCFLWCCGTTPQKTSTGLLRTLLYEALQDMIYGPLEQDPAVVRWLFTDRWKRFASYGGGLQSYTMPELRAAFELLISDLSKKYLFMIDGLDELDDDPTSLLEIITKATQRENVKICVSSRLSPVYQQAFANRPFLEIDRWMKRGILSYVLYAFDQNDTMFNIPAEESDGTQERAIINTIVEKASGVFLWASLGTEYLIQSTTASDNVARIRARVDALPSELDRFLAYIFDNIDARDLGQVSRLLLLVDAHGYPSLLPLCFATDVDTRSGLAAECRPLTMSDILRKVEDMRDLLKSKCKGLLSIFDAVASDEDTNTADLHNFRVNYTHRCVRDFVQEKAMRKRIQQVIGYSASNADEHWSNAQLWILKTLPPRDEHMRIWDVLAGCIEYAMRLEAESRRVRLTYLDEISATLDHHLSMTAASSMDLPPHATVQSFLDIAVWLNLSGYVTIKAKTANKKELRHSIEYNKEVRRNLGSAGQDKWLGKRLKLNENYTRNDEELSALLDFYTKSIRFSTSKPPPGEMPEWV